MLTSSIEELKDLFRALISRLLTVGATIFVTLVALKTIAAFGAEGFGTRETLPPALAKAWEGTFGIILETDTSYFYGTAFLVEKRLGKTSTELYFITNKHVSEASCPAKGICSNTSLAEEIHLIHTPKGLHIQSLDGVVLDPVEVVSSSGNPDLSLLRVNVSSSRAKTLQPLKLSDSCDLKAGDPLYSIGLSDPLLRTAPGHLAIPDSERIYKRWSQGIFTGEIRPDFNNFYTGSSVDLLEGGSGGPLVNVKGEVVGAMVLTASKKENQWHYDGNEDPDHLDWQSLAIRCDRLKDFIAANLPPQELK